MLSLISSLCFLKRSKVLFLFIPVPGWPNAGQSGISVLKKYFTKVKRIHPASLPCKRWTYIHPALSHCWWWKRSPWTSLLLSVERDPTCTSELLVVEMDTCASHTPGNGKEYTLHVLTAGGEKDTLCKPILLVLVVVKDSQCTSKLQVVESDTLKRP